ncbi:accessory protein p15 [Capuchin kidney parvovirus]|uniref:Accessory protein p15 n=1 Tax=Capuchin kidney parvovirus TaxID=2695302 RepID=A0A6B9LAT4_9VIRU|nr:accessory protein p15 [Capuchin kidney parvovirus]QHB35438.1 accessory protein p15 [Capuchin kidney parvovirus]
MSMWTGPTGFSLLLISEHDKEYLEDAVCLLANRWHIEFEAREHEGVWYAWGKQSRFTVAETTLQRALGDLYSQGFITFQKGPPDTSFDSALRYQKCKRKWNVPDVVSQPCEDIGGGGMPVMNFRKKGKS